MNLFVGEILELREEAVGRAAVVSVRGARVTVAADLVPSAQVGDAVLIHAGVALARLGEEDLEALPCV